MSEFQIILLSVIIAVYIIIFLFGIKQKIVIYYDLNDLLISLLPGLSIVFALFFAEVYNLYLDYNKVFNLPTYLIILIGVLLSLGGIIWTIILSTKKSMRT